MQFIDDRFEYTFGIIGIINGKTGWIAYPGCFGSKNAGKHTVECTYVQIIGFPVAQDFFNTFLHFPGGLIGKCQCQDPE